MRLHFFSVSLATFPKAEAAGGAGERLEGDGKRKSMCFWVKVNFQWEIGGQKEPQEPSYLCPSLTALGSVLKSSYVLCTAPHRPVSPATFREFQSPLSSISGEGSSRLCYLISVLPTILFGFLALPSTV